MAAYQGARLRNDAPSAAASLARSSRAVGPAAAGTTPRVRPMGLLMAAIVAATMVGMVYLTQTLGTNATSYEIYQLEGERNDLIVKIKRLEIKALDMTQAEELEPLARKQGLKRLDEPVVLPAP